MTYAEQLAKAQEKGKVKERTFAIISWHEPGDELTGKLLNVSAFKGGKFETEVNQYLIETDDGVVSTVLGSYADSQIMGSVQVGDLVHILYQGKAQLDDGRSVNRFNISTFSSGKPKDA